MTPSDLMDWSLSIAFSIGVIGFVLFFGYGLMQIVRDS